MKQSKLMYTKIITYLVVYLPHTMFSLQYASKMWKYLKDQSDRVVIILLAKTLQ